MSGTRGTAAALEQQIGHDHPERVDREYCGVGVAVARTYGNGCAFGTAGAAANQIAQLSGAVTATQLTNQADDMLFLVDGASACQSSAKNVTFAGVSGTGRDAEGSAGALRGTLGTKKLSHRPQAVSVRAMRRAPKNGRSV